MREQNSELYSLLKAAEGGFAQKTAIMWLKDGGIVAKPDYSIYVGHYGLRVYGNKRIQAKAGKILFGR